MPHCDFTSLFIVIRAKGSTKKVNSRMYYASNGIANLAANKINNIDIT